MTEEPQTAKGKRLKLEVTNIDALKAKYPDAVKQQIVVREDYTRLYELATAHLIIGEAIPGVTITHPDGRVLCDEITDPNQPKFDGTTATRLADDA